MVMVAFLSLSSLPAQNIVSDPVADYLSREKRAPGETLWRVSADVNGDSNNEIFLALDGKKRGDQVREWTVYSPVSWKLDDGFRRLATPVLMDSKKLFVGVLDPLPIQVPNGMIYYRPDNHLMGRVFYLTLEEGILRENLVGTWSIEGKEKDLYHHFFIRHAPPSTEPVEDLELYQDERVTGIRTPDSTRTASGGSSVPSTAGSGPANGSEPGFPVWLWWVLDILLLAGVVWAFRKK